MSSLRGKKNENRDFFWGGVGGAVGRVRVQDFFFRTPLVVVLFSFWSELLGSTGFVRKFLCTPCICGRPAEVQPRPDARVVRAVES